MTTLSFTPEHTSSIPSTPGVYLFIGPEKEMLYIGKAINLKARVRSHFRQPTSKDAIFLPEITTIQCIETESEIEALLLEASLIKEKKPRYNVAWMDDKQYAFVAITKEKLPRVFITRQPAKESVPVRVIGPFVDSSAVRRILRLLRRVFPHYTTKSHPEEPCPSCKIRLCPGPDPDIKAYKASLKKLETVLKGNIAIVRSQLEKDMATASATHNFESAAKIRDQIRDLSVLFLHHADNKAREPKSKEEELLQWKIAQMCLEDITHVPDISRIEAYDISNTQGQEATASMVVFIDGKPARSQYRKFKMRLTGSPNDVAMMREALTRRFNHAEWDFPSVILLDGGKPQLRAVEKVKRETPGMANIPLIALAKRHNELFREGNPRPILLRNMPDQASHVLLWLRDEAHRFAIIYHRKLRAKRILS